MEQLIPGWRLVTFGQINSWIDLILQQPWKTNYFVWESLEAKGWRLVGGPAKKQLDACSAMPFLYSLVCRGMKQSPCTGFFICFLFLFFILFLGSVLKNPVRSAHSKLLYLAVAPLGLMHPVWVVDQPNRCSRSSDLFSRIDVPWYWPHCALLLFKVRKSYRIPPQWSSLDLGCKKPCTVILMSLPMVSPNATAVEIPMLLGTSVSLVYFFY